MGAYAAILRRTPDHEDLVTATESKVLCRVVGRWVGQGGKASLANTADADIFLHVYGRSDPDRHSGEAARDVWLQEISVRPPR